MKLTIVYYLYKDDENLKLSLDSLFKEFNEEIEIIFIDDYSQENVFNIYSQYDISHKNIKLIKFKENFGVSYSSNFALNIAKGDYIYFAEQKTIFLDNFFSNFCKIIGSKIFDFITFDKKTSILLNDNSSFFEEKNTNSKLDASFIVNSKLSVKYKIFNRKFLLKNNIKFQEYKNCHSLFIFDVTENAKIWLVSNKQLLNWCSSPTKTFDYNIYDILQSSELLSIKLNKLNINEERREAYKNWVSILVLYEFLNKMFISYPNDKKILLRSIENANDIIKKLNPLYKKNNYLNLILNKNLYSYISNFVPTIAYVKKNLF